VCRVCGIFLAIAGLGAGIVAAWHWYRSSKVSIDPGWGYPGRPGPPQPGDPEMQQMAWTAATIDAFSQAAELNRKASLWTAAAVLINGIVAAVSSLG
jgi:hypothetical protein